MKVGLLLFLYLIVEGPFQTGSGAEAKTQVFPFI